jgi:hypothetical protein
MAIYYFWTGSGNWNVLTNWSTAQNIHTPPATLPNFGDQVAFESGSLLSGLGSSATSSTMTGDFSCSAIVFGTGYTGSLTMSNAVLHINAGNGLTNGVGQVNLTSATTISGSGGRSGFRIYGSSSISSGGGRYTGSLVLAKAPFGDNPAAQGSLSATHSLVNTFNIKGNVYLNDISSDAVTSISPWYINDISGNGSGGIVVDGTVYLIPLSYVTGSSFVKLVGAGGFIVSQSTDTPTNGAYGTYFGLYNNTVNYGLNIDSPGNNVYFISDLTTSSYTARRRNLFFVNTTIQINNGNILIPNSGSTLGISNLAAGSSTVTYIKNSSVTDFVIPRIFPKIGAGTSQTITFNYDQSTPFETNILAVNYTATGQFFINSGSVNTPFVIRGGQVSIVSAGSSYLSGSATLILTGSRGALVQLYAGTGVDPKTYVPIIIDCTHFVLGRWLHTVPEQPSATSGSVGWSNPLKLSGSFFYNGPSLTTGSRVQTWQTTGPSNKGSALVIAPTLTNANTTLSTYPIVFDQVYIAGSSTFNLVTASLLSELSASTLTVSGASTTFIPVGGGFEVGTYNVQTPGTTQSFGTSSTAPTGNTYTYDFNILNNFISSGSQTSPITYRAVPVNAGRSASLNLEVGGAQHVTWSLNRDVDSGRGQAITSSLGSDSAPWTNLVSGVPNSPYLTRQVNWYAFGAAVLNTITVKKFLNTGAESDAYGTVTVGDGPNAGNVVLTSGTTTVSSDSTVRLDVEASPGYIITEYGYYDGLGNFNSEGAVNGPGASIFVDGAFGNRTLVIKFALLVYNIFMKPQVNGSITHNESSTTAVGPTPNVVTVGAGTNNTFTITPNVGYQIQNVILYKYSNPIPRVAQTVTTYVLGPVSTAEILNIDVRWDVVAFFSLIPPPSTGTTSSYAQLALRYCLGSDNKKENWYTTSSYRSQHPNQNITKFDTGISKEATFHNFPSTISYYNPIVEVHSTEWPDLSGNRSISNKIRVDSVFLAGENGNVLYRNNSIQRSITDNQPPDTSRLGVYFSPTNETNQDIAEQFGGLSIDDFIGDPSYLSLESYPGLEELHFGYFKKYGHHWKASGSNADITSSMRPPGPQNYVRLLKHYDASLFKLIKKFIPYRANAQVGLVIEPHLLSRSKIPTKTPIFENLAYTSSIDIPEVYTPGGFVQDGDGEPFRNGPGYVQEAIIDSKRVVGTTAEVLPVQIEDTIDTQIIQPLQLSGNANEYNNGGIDDQPSGYDVGDRLYDEIDFGITSYGRDARVQGSQYIFTTYATSGSGNNVSEPYLITSSRYDYHEPYSPVILDSRRSEIANVTNNIYDRDIFFDRAFDDYTLYGNNATPSTQTLYTSSNAIWENNWTSRFGLQFVSLTTASVLQPSPYNTATYWLINSTVGLRFAALHNAVAGVTIPVTASARIPAFFYDELSPASKDYLYNVSVIVNDISNSTHKLFFGSLNSALTQSVTFTSTETTFNYTTKATGNYLGLQIFTTRNGASPVDNIPSIKSLKVECLNYRASVQDFHLQDSYGMRNARYDGCKLTATDYNVDSTDTVDGGPVIQITVGGGNELLVRPGNKGVFTTQTLLKSGQQQIKKKGGLGSL